MSFTGSLISRSRKHGCGYESEMLTPSSTPVPFKYEFGLYVATKTDGNRVKLKATLTPETFLKRENDELQMRVLCYELLPLEFWADNESVINGKSFPRRLTNSSLQPLAVAKRHLIRVSPKPGQKWVSTKQIAAAALTGLSLQPVFPLKPTTGDLTSMQNIDSYFTSAESNIKSIFMRPTLQPGQLTNFNRVQQFFNAIYATDYITLRFMLSHQPSLCYTALEPLTGRTPLMAVLFIDKPLQRRRYLKWFIVCINKAAQVEDTRTASLSSSEDVWEQVQLAVDSQCKRDLFAWTCSLGFVEEAKLLLKVISPYLYFKRLDTSGSTYLHLAVESGSYQLVRLLAAEAVASYRVQIDDCIDAFGQTALQVALARGYLNIVKLLTEYGCDLSKANN